MGRLNRLISQLKRFKKSPLGTYGVATTVLSVPLFVVAQYTLSNTEDLRNQIKVERAFDTAADLITIEDSKYRVKTNGAECKAVLNKTTYEQLSQLTPQCQYYVYIADIENRTGVKNLLDPAKRNKVITEAVMRIFNPIGKENVLYPRSSADLLTKNVVSDCDIKDTNIGPAIFCFVKGEAKTENLFQGQYRSRSILTADNNYSFRSAGASKATPLNLNHTKPVDIIIAVDISAPFIPNYTPLLNGKEGQDGRLEKRYRTDDINNQYNETVKNLQTISDFIGKVETALFNKNMLDKVYTRVQRTNNDTSQVRLSYLAFSGGGQQFPEDFTKRENVLPYVVRGETPTGIIYKDNRSSTPIDRNPKAIADYNNNLKFHFASNRLLQNFYFPFLKSQNGYVDTSAQCGRTIENGDVLGCTFMADPRVLQTQTYFNVPAKNTIIGYNPGINQTESLLLQFLKTRFDQINSTYDSNNIGTKGFCADPTYNPQGTGYGTDGVTTKELLSYQYGITCSGKETKTTNEDPKVGVSPLFAGIFYDFVDVKATIDKIKKFDGTLQHYKLTRRANHSDTIIPLPQDHNRSTFAAAVGASTGSRVYVDTPDVESKTSFVEANKNNTGNAIDASHYPNLFNFTPTRNTANSWNAYHYLNGYGVELVSGIREKDGYMGGWDDSHKRLTDSRTQLQTVNGNNIEILKEKFAKIKPSGIQYPSAGLILAANRLLSYDVAKYNGDKSSNNSSSTGGADNTDRERVIILITNNRGEKQSALLDRQLVDAGMCNAIRERLTEKNNVSSLRTVNNNLNARIFVVDIYPTDNGKTNSYAQEIHKKTWMHCADSNYQNEQQYNSSRLVIKTNGGYERSKTENYFEAKTDNLESVLDQIIQKVTTPTHR